ncbi:Trk system potassium transporter TrkA [Desulfoprunum benzoelyticum]|uniref:Trk system potassium uptake protein TrkA n=1 Tax=Desulfoprunum benzoelyticum TaxID=1506996 RepID=A0A840UQP7_9BACT|nr:Trk system potassium transporter TrkA [Desulfoprunum benzoelyticum]MBB5346953.1 trk system potassium uptake protein TrkA [Desulfoprunum benzoelyticum]MBM9531029.1 Trk system potassium transporter TrkA [Desulfoprunum benzoelyticum]
MRIIIVGAGQVGFHICERFSLENQDVVLIDTDEKKLKRIERDLNIMTIHGSGASARILAEAGIAKTDLFIAVTDSDEVNLIACIMSSQYNVKTRIARVRNQDFLEEGMFPDTKVLDIDMIISPDQAMTDEIVSLCHISAAFDMAKFADGRLMLLGYQIKAGNPRLGMTLNKLMKVHGSHNFIMTAIIRGKDTIIPRGDDAIEAGDKIYIMVRREDIFRVEKFFHLSSRTPHKVFIIGGGRIGYAVARALEDLNIEVFLVENNRQRCEFLSENLGRTTVLNIDGLDSHDLLDEGIDQADLVISLTSDDSNNIMSSLLAKYHGARKCITKITRHDFVPLLGSLGIDIALSSRQVAASMILRFVRRGAVGTVATIMNSDAEAMEIKVPMNRNFENVALKDLDFPKGAIIGAIVRGRKILIPSGNTRVQADDNLVVFFTRDAVKVLEQYFE